MRSELALRKRKDKWMKSQTQCVSTAPLTNCVSSPLALPRLHGWHCCCGDHFLGDNFLGTRIAYCDGKFYLYYSVGHEDGIISCALPAIARWGRIRTSDRWALGLPLLDPRSGIGMVSGICSTPAISWTARLVCPLALR